MTITLTYLDAHSLAREFAQDVHTEVTGRRLSRVGTALSRSDSRLREIQGAVKSIPDAWERRQFANTMRYHLEAIRKERNTPARWQDYVQQVAEADARRNAA